MTISIDEFETWRKDLIDHGRIFDDAPDRGRHYLDLLERVAGTEGVDVFHAILDSLQSQADHGAYQSAYRALHRFPPSVFADAMIGRLPLLIAQNPHWAGEILCGATDESVMHLNQRLAHTDSLTRRTVMAFVEEQEVDGWLDSCPGLIRPTE